MKGRESLDVVSELQKEIRELRKELQEQWEFNHAEHCENNWPHEGPCQWPKPKIIENG